jgi:hypothetical protein
MALELFCDSRNERGLRFWTSDRRDFEIIGPGYGDCFASFVYHRCTGLT